MKKIVSITLAALICLFMLAGCGSQETDVTTEPDTSEAETTAPAELAYTIVINGEKKTGKTAASTVGELLKEEGIETGETVTVEPAADTAITDGIEIVVKNAEEETEGTTEAESTTKAPVTTTKAPVTTTKAPVTTTKAPVTTTKAPETEATTKAPVTEKTEEPAGDPTEKPTEKTPETTTAAGKTVVSRQDVPDCDGSGHGYYIITYSDGTTEYQDY